MPSLVVVDMQPRFKSAQHEWLIKRVGLEIQSSMKAGHAIIFLEFARPVNALSDHGNNVGIAVKDMTHRRLTDLVADYDNAIVVHKATKDGSDQVIAVLESLDYDIGSGSRLYDDLIFVVGVNRSVCVSCTAAGLVEKMSDSIVVVIEEACGDLD